MRFLTLVEGTRNVLPSGAMREGIMTEAFFFEEDGHMREVRGSGKETLVFGDILIPKLTYVGGMCTGCKFSKLQDIQVFPARVTAIHPTQKRYGSLLPSSIQTTRRCNPKYFRRSIDTHESVEASIKIQRYIR